MSALDQIRARLEAATPGPWHVDGEPYEVKSLVQYAREGEVIVGTYISDVVERDEDATFIANAPTDIARLLAALDAVHALASDLEQLADGDKHYAGLMRKAIESALQRNQA